MSFKQLLKNVANPAAILGLLGAVISTAVAFGAPLSEAQSHSVLVFGGAISLVLFAHGITNALAYLTPQTVTGLVTAIIGVGVAFGLNITEAQTTQILTLTGALSGLLLVHGAVHTIARDRRAPAPTAVREVEEREPIAPRGAGSISGDATRVTKTTVAEPFFSADAKPQGVISVSGGVEALVDGKIQEAFRRLASGSAAVPAPPAAELSE